VVGDQRARRMSILQADVLDAADDRSTSGVPSAR
jgi:hypothetical protein